MKKLENSGKKYQLHPSVSDTYPVEEIFYSKKDAVSYCRANGLEENIQEIK